MSILDCYHSDTECDNDNICASNTCNIETGNLPLPVAVMSTWIAMMVWHV